MSQGQNPAPVVKVTTAPSGQTVVFDGSGSTQSQNSLSTTKILTPPAPPVDPKLAPNSSVHGAVANSANVSILFPQTDVSNLERRRTPME